MSELPTPISDQDKLLSNIAIGTPNIEDLIPNSRQEVYLKYIALNGTQGTYESPVSIENGGTGATTSEEARQNLGINLPLPVENGGTGGTTAEEARQNLGINLPLPIENGGTGATTAGEARENLDLMHRAWLYENSSGTTGTITLYDSAFNYKFIEIFFRTGVYFRGSVMLQMDGEQIISGMNFINPTSGFAYCDARTIIINGTSITNGDTGHFGIENDKTYSSSDNSIYITRVIGYSYYY